MEIISERHKEYGIKYERKFDFTEDKSSWLSFPCDKEGNLLDNLSDEQLDEYNKCLNGEIKVIDKGISIDKWSWTENAVGICDNCKREVELWDEYYGACMCECGQWYSVNGQTLNPPNMWEEPIESDDY